MAARQASVASRVVKPPRAMVWVVLLAMAGAVVVVGIVATFLVFAHLGSTPLAPRDVLGPPARRLRADRGQPVDSKRSLDLSPAPGGNADSDSRCVHRIFRRPEPALHTVSDRRDRHPRVHQSCPGTSAGPDDHGRECVGARARSRRVGIYCRIGHAARRSAADSGLMWPSRACLCQQYRSCGE